jgi:hypothetical protein
MNRGLQKTGSLRPEDSPQDEQLCMARLAVLCVKCVASSPTVEQDRVQDRAGGCLVRAVMDKPTWMVRDSAEPSPLADHVDPSPEGMLQPDPVGAGPSSVLVNQLKRNVFSCCLLDPLTHVLLGLLLYHLLRVVPIRPFSARSPHARHSPAADPRLWSNIPAHVHNT